MRVEYIVIHCSDTENFKRDYWCKVHKRREDIGIEAIDEWHAAKGYRRAKHRKGDLRHVGYHRVIDLDGIVWEGRDLDEPGAHCPGVNTKSWGICLLGRDAFTGAQWQSLRAEVDALLAIKAGLEIRGHRDFNSTRNCPGFDVRLWWQGILPHAV
jgi:hypothetical protein